MKKIIVCVLLPVLFIYFTGCYSIETVSKDEFLKDNKRKKVEVITCKAQKYGFDEHQYVINADTLSGTGARYNGSEKDPFSGSIPLKDIAIFNTENFNAPATAALSFGVIILTTVSILLIILKPKFYFQIGVFN